jgi:hypothetical protein
VTGPLFDIFMSPAVRSKKPDAITTKSPWWVLALFVVGILCDIMIVCVLLFSMRPRALRIEHKLEAGMNNIRDAVEKLPRSTYNVTPMLKELDESNPQNGDSKQ